MFLPVPSVTNIRDFAALATQQGTHIGPLQLIRSGELSKLSDADLQTLSETYRVRHVFDLRDPFEMQRAPDRDIPGCTYHAASLLPGLPMDHKLLESQEPAAMRALLQEIYRTIAESDHAAHVFRQIFDTLLASPPGESVLWHCTQGKDRTGTTASLILCALGVPEPVIWEDYFLSNEAFAQQYEAIETQNERQRAFLREVLFVSEAVLDQYRGAIRTHYGSLEGYLRERLALTDADFATLRARYTI